ncbi:tripartite motif-containing protein 10-like isoform X2 [Chelonia mydas]|uniref:tripartite motif-containing protein 10-like isoform X2 n=1 Tax=Chelonia mydas TaxID=8469 RepID=UPI001CA9B05A|nr:tripartite motif-containing protein 10-like isoform X2 [Chelonia mydas]
MDHWSDPVCLFLCSMFPCYRATLSLLHKEMAAERQKMVWEWQELRGFLEEQEQRLLSQLEELERAIVQRRDEGICRLSWEISLLSERGGEKGQQPLSQPLQEPPREHRAPLGKEREAAKAEKQQQSEELLKEMAAERQKMVWEWQELRGFLEEQEQRLLSQLEELERAIVQRRDEGICRLPWEISLLSERGGEKGQQPLSQPLQEPPREHRAPLGKEREAAKAEEQQQSEELLAAE